MGDGWRVTDYRSHITACRARSLESGYRDLTLCWEGGIEAFGIDAAEDIKGVGADCVVMAVSYNAFKDISLSALKGVM